MPWSIPYSPLPNGSTSYVSVLASDLAGNTTVYADAFSIYKNAMGPEIIVNVIGDNTWRNTLASAYYNVNFLSHSGMNLNGFDVMVTSTTDGSGIQYTTWSTVMSNLNTEYYSTSWQLLPDSHFFNAWPQGKNYVNIRLYDTVPTTTTLYGAFYIMKDTAPPYITNLQPNATFYINSGGALYNVNFFDAGIGVSTAQYMVSSSSITPAGDILGWTNIFTQPPQQSNTTPWPVNFNALSQSATNYVSVQAFDDFGYSVTSYTVFSILKDTTAPNTPSATSPLTGFATNYTSVPFVWGSVSDNGPAGLGGYSLVVSTSADFGAVYASSNTVSTQATLQLSNSSTYYWRVRAADNAANSSPWSSYQSIIIDTFALTSPTNLAPPDMTITGSTNITFSWNPPAAGPSGVSHYDIYISTAVDFSAITSSSSVTTNSYNVTFSSENVYFWKLRAVDNAMTYSPYTSTYTLTIDISPPTISTNNVGANFTGDFTWRNTAKPGGYDVEFFDNMGLLNNAYYAVYTGTGATGNLQKNWQPIFTNLNQKQYTSPWQVDFNSLAEGGTNYVSVTLTDTLLHTATYYDIFFVLKDITKPTIVNNMPANSDSAWRSANTGSYGGSSGVNFYDLPVNGSNLDRFQLSMDGFATVFSTPALSIGTTFYTSNWQLPAQDFTKLVEGANNISVRIFDKAGNNTTLTNAFVILKDTTAPVISSGTWDTTAWNSAPPAVNVYFNDALSGSGIQSFSIMVTTANNISSAPILVNTSSWVLVTTTNTYAYAQPWRIPQNVFNSMINSATNYCWVSASDFATNITTAPFYFAVKKDTSSVVINYSAETGQDPVWRSTSTARAYNIYFSTTSGTTSLGGAQYIAYTQKNMSGTNLFSTIGNWASISTNTIAANTSWYIGSAQFAQLWESTTNYISVRAWTTAGSTITQNDVFYVLKDTTPPNTPVMVSPSSGTYTNSLTQTFNWQTASDLTSGTTIYRILLSSSPSFAAQTSTSAITYAASATFTLVESTYYWKVQAKDLANNWSNIYSTWTIVVDTTPPAQLVLIPLTNATTNYAVQNFSWNTGSDNTSGIAYYKLDISNTANFTGVVYTTNTVQLSNTFTLPSPATYWWRVFPVDMAGNFGTFNSTYTVIFDSGTGLPAPTLTAPLDGMTTNYTYPAFSWTCNDTGPAGIKNFALEFSTYSNFTLLYASSSVSALSSTATLAQNAYWWRVKAQDQAGNYSAYSATRSFIMDVSSPGAPSLVLPSSDTRTNSLSINFMWNATPDNGPAGTYGYDLYTSTDSAFGVFTSSSFIIAPSTSATLSFSPMVYYWKVRAKDLAGNTGVFCSTRTFTIDTQNPLIVNNQPADNNWHNTGTTAYNVSFFDLPSSFGAGLSSASYTVYTSTNSNGTAAGALVVSSNIFTNALPTRNTSFVNNGNWTMSDVWPNLVQGYNFVFLGVNDFAGNSVQNSTYTFYIMKDTAAPVYVSYESTPAWTNATKNYNVNVFDYGSGIRFASYTVNSAANLGGSTLINWTTFIDSSPYIMSSTNTWTFNFNLLNSGTNYVSIRTEDALANRATYNDVFRVWKDTTPPNSVANLSATISTCTAGAINISWTAPSDADSGVSSYLVKYTSTSFAGLTDFLSSPNTFYQSWTPLTPGMTEGLNGSRVVTGLAEGTTYFIGIMPYDKAGNLSLAVSTATTFATTVPPAQITTLVASSGGFPGEIELTWTSVGNNGYSGTAQGYLVKYSPSPIGVTSSTQTYANFINATTFYQNWTPQPAGNLEDYTVTSLNPNTLYYLAIEAYDSAGNYSLISDTVSALATAAGAASGMLTYGTGSSALPNYKIWTGSAFNTSSTTLTTSSNIRYIRLKPCNVVRNQKVMGVLAYNGNGTAPDGDLFVQVWDGTAQTWNSLGRMNASAGSMYSAYRGFDIAYEQVSGRALIIYFDGASGAVSYKVYSSTAAAIVAQGTLNVGTVTNSYWIRTTPRPGADQIMMCATGANSNIFAALWNGPTNSWVSVSTRTVTTTASIAGTKEIADVDWEHQTGRAVIAWGQGAATPWWRYDVWSSTMNAWLTAATQPTGYAGTAPTTAATINWLNLCSDPRTTSNMLGIMLIDASSHLNASVWSGSAWGAMPTNIAPTVSSIISRCGDIAFEANSSTCVVVASTAAATTNKYMSWSSCPSGGSFSALAQDSTFAWGNTIGYLELTADPNTNRLMATGIDTTCSLKTRDWYAGSWSNGVSHTSQVSGWISNTYYAYQPAQLALDLYDIIPPTINDNALPAISNPVQWTNADILTYPIYFNDTGGSHLSQVQVAVYTSQGFSGTQLKDFPTGSPEITGINADSYSTPWPLSANTFNLLGSGTNYVSVKVYDGAGNSIINQDEFKVWKDTQPPYMVNQDSITTPGYDGTWLNYSTHTYNVQFFDQPGLSGVSTAKYCAYTGPNNTGNQQVNWTPIFGPYGNTSGSPSYTTPWQLNFNLLAHNTNYISVMVVDVAGSTTTITDLFRVLSDTIPPAQINSLSASAGPYRGTVNLQWTAPGDDGNQVTNSGGNYMVAYATFAITSSALISQATTFASYTPQNPPGFTEALTITGLTTNTTYFFAVRATDKAGNFSLSNSPSSLPRADNVYINEVYPVSAGWVELYNAQQSAFSLAGSSIVCNNGTSDVSFTPLSGYGSSLASGAFLVVNISNLNSYKFVKLVNPSGLTMDLVQWPTIGTGSSFSRITDGNPNYFDINPTPTKGYSNRITTSPVKINEIDYSSTPQFVELYNSSMTTTVPLIGWTLRNSNNTSFTFTTKNLYGGAFTGVDSSSIDNSSNTWSTDFNGGLNPTSDFLVLENPAGQVVDRVVWGTGNNQIYCSTGTPVAYNLATLGGIVPPYTLSRSVADGYDTGNNNQDFGQLNASYGRRNVNPLPTSANTLYYPTSNSYMSYASQFNIYVSADVSAGINNTLLFVRTGGTADPKSPHIFMLNNLGYVLNDPSLQAVPFTGITAKDIDGNSLINGASYKIILNSENGSGAAPQVILSAVTYDASVSSASAMDSTLLFGNDSVKVPLLRIDITNNSPSGANSIVFTSATVHFTDAAGNPLSQGNMQSLFNDIIIVADNLTYGTTGTYQAALDTATLVDMPIGSFYSGGSTVTLISTDITGTIGKVLPQQTRTFFVVANLGSAADGVMGSIGNAFKTYITPGAETAWQEPVTGIFQPATPKSTVFTSTLTVITPPTSGSGSSGFPGGPATVVTPGNQISSLCIDDDNQASVYANTTNNELVALNTINSGNTAGTQKWVFQTNAPVIASYSGSGNVYIGTSDGKLYKIYDNGSGVTPTYLWGSPMDLGGPVSGLTIAGLANQYIFIGTQDGRFFKVDPAGFYAAGWDAAPGLDGAVFGTPVIDEFSQASNNTGVWFGSLAGSMFMLNNGDGTVKAQAKNSTSIKTSPWYVGGFKDSNKDTFVVYYGDDNGFMRCRNSSNLQPPSGWTDTPLGGAGAPIRSSPWYDTPSTSTVVLYFGDDNGKFYQVNALTGQVNWTFQTKGPIRTLPMPGTGTVYFGSNDGCIYGLETTHGTLLPGFPVITGGEVMTNPVSDGTNIYFGSNDGKVYCVDAP
jgi:hypothetical protein